MKTYLILFVISAIIGWTAIIYFLSNSNNAVIKLTIFRRKFGDWKDNKITDRKAGCIIMETMEFRGRLIEVTKDWYLVRLEDWSREWPKYLANEAGIELTPEHWWFIDQTRSHYEEHGSIPFLKHLLAKAENELGYEKGQLQYMYRLFPGGFNSVCKFAGIPKPAG